MLDRHSSRLLYLILLGSLLSACGGGGGGSGGGSANSSFSLSKSALTLTAAQAEDAPSDGSVKINIRNLPDDGLFVALDYDENGIDQADFFQTSNTLADLFVWFKPPSSLPLGTYRDEVRVAACYDEACTRHVTGSPATLSVTYVVEATPTMTVDGTERRVVASLGDEAPPAETVEVTFDTVPTRGIFLSALAVGDALSGATVTQVSPGTRRVQVSLPDPDTLGTGTERGALIVTACFENPCARQINQGEQRVEFVYRVAADPVATTQVLSLGAKDVVFDPISNLIYTAQPASAPLSPNSIAAVDPSSGTLVGAVVTVNDPRLVAVSDDGSKFYAAVPSTNQVQRFSAPSFTSDLVITVPPNSPEEAANVNQIAVAPGSPGTLAISRYGRVFVFDDAVGRQDIYGDGALVHADTVEWGDTDEVLYSSDTTVVGQDVDLYKLTVSASGPAAQATFVDAMDAGPRIHFSEARIYSDTGRVINAETGSVVGNFTPSDTTSFTRRVAIDATRRLAYMAIRRFGDPTGTLRVDVFNLDTFARIRTFEVPVSDSNNWPVKLVRWSDNGLAVLDSLGNVALVDGPLVTAPPP